MAATAGQHRFEQRQVWGHLAEDPGIQHRAQMLEQMIPDGVKQIVDVGCGDGAITDRLAKRWEVIGVDSSPTALEHVATTTILASATALPLRDRSCDLVLSSEMLEHLTPDDYARAVAEMRRVTRRFVLLSVPYREDLRFRTVRCPRCRWRGHVWGHRRRFTAESLLLDLPGFSVLETRTFGPLQPPPWPSWLLWFSHNVLRSYYYAPGQNPLCERCGNTEFETTRAIPPALVRLNSRIQARRNPRMPFCVAVLAERSAS